MSAPVRIVGASRRRGRKEVLRDVHVSVGRGELVAVVGPNGAGKSTLLRSLLGLSRLDRGEALLLGRPIERHPAPAAVVGVQVDRVLPDPRLTGRQHLDLCRGWAGVPDGAGAPALLASAEVADYLDERVATYSTGMARRLALVTAFLFDPPVVVLDEPSDGLDPWAKRWLTEQLEHHRQGGGAALVATHDAAVAGVADRVVLLQRGRVVRDQQTEPGPLHELLGGPG